MLGGLTVLNASATLGGLVRQTSADLRTQAERQHKSMALHVLSLKATLRNMSASIGTVAADDEPPPPPVHELHRTVSELSGKLEDVARILRHTGGLAGGEGSTGGLAPPILPLPVRKAKTSVER